MRLHLLEGVRTLQRSGLHPSHASGITDTLTEPGAMEPLVSAEVKIDGTGAGSASSILSSSKAYSMALVAVITVRPRPVNRSRTSTWPPSRVRIPLVNAPLKQQSSISTMRRAGLASISSLT